MIVATNGHWHVLATIHACQAGKDVYVEKPLGTSIGEGRAAVQAARKYDRVVQLGTQQRTWPHYRQAVEAIQAGKLGEISEVKVWDLRLPVPRLRQSARRRAAQELDWDFWLGPSPKVPYNPNRYIRHYWFFDYAGGWQVDWAVHHYDIVHWCLGVKAPDSATAMGGFHCFEETNTQWPDTFYGICEYGPGPVAKKGFSLQYTFRGGCRAEQRSHAKCFYGSEASMILDRSGYTIASEARRQAEAGRRDRVGAERIYEGRPRREPQGARRKFSSTASATRKPSPADVEMGHFATNPGHLMNIAWRRAARSAGTPRRNKSLDDPEANALVTKSYRAPWKLEV